jgi:hypothetical protein
VLEAMEIGRKKIRGGDWNKNKNKWVSHKGHRDFSYYYLTP